MTAELRGRRATKGEEARRAREGGEEREGTEPCDRTVSMTALLSSDHLTLQALTPAGLPTDRGAAFHVKHTDRPIPPKDDDAHADTQYCNIEIWAVPRSAGRHASARFGWPGPMAQLAERPHPRRSARVPIHASTKRPVRWQHRTDGPNGKGRPPFVRPRVSANVIWDCSGTPA